MTDHPMIFSPETVRALLDGRKTQTRRLLKPNNTLFNGRPWSKLHRAQEWAWDDAWVDPGPSPLVNPGPYLKLPWRAGDECFEGTVHRIYPSIQPGDRIWVKEECAVWQKDHVDIVYRADVTGDEWRDLTYGARKGAAWTAYSRMFMPKRFSRLTNVVTDVRVQRVQDITEADARAEGAEHRDGFRDLWNRIHGPDAWDRNDWIVARTFDVHKRNILEMDG